MGRPDLARLSEVFENLSSSHGEGDEAGEQVREGPVRQVGCLPWDQDVDGRWADQVQPDEEQEREDREQEGERERQEGLRPDQGLDRRRGQGAQGLEREGLRAVKKGTALYKKAKEFYGQ